MDKSKRFVAIVVCMMFMVSSAGITAVAEGNNNLYPNPQPGINAIKDELMFSQGRNLYNYGSLTINGNKDGGTVKDWKDSKDLGINWLYTLEVAKEGMVSINVDALDVVDENGSLHADVYMNDPRTDPDHVENNNDVQTFLDNRPNNWYVDKNYVFYAYPGVYYVHVWGGDNTASRLISYTISATQEVYEQNYGSLSVNYNNLDYPDDLGTTSLTDNLSIKGTRCMENWRKANSSGGLGGQNINSSDYFTFTATKTGRVYYKLANHNSTILDTYLAARHSISNSTEFVPMLSMSLIEPGVANLGTTEVGYGREIKDSFEVEAGSIYRVSISGSTLHPMSYSLDLSYSENLPGEIKLEGASAWALEEINASIGAGLQTTKMMKGDYKSFASREEFAELVMRLYDQLGGANVSSGDNPFVDTTNTEIIRARNAGIINGTSATTFGPSANLTREQLCVMILRALEATDTSYNTNVNFQKTYSDTKDISSWALESVRVLNSYKIINGSGEGLDPKSTVTKEVAILMLYRAYELFK